MKRVLNNGLLVILAVLCAASCVTTRKIAYLQDLTHGSQIELEDTFEAVISPYDELDIVISCFDQELAKPFNLYSMGSGTMNSTNGLAYLVDQYGDIELPVLGKIHAAGLTRLKLQERIREMLVEGNYISDPFVMARFRNFKIFFLGSNGGKAITIPNERCTFLEALALSGDLNVYTQRNKIAVMREIDGQIKVRYLDPRSSKVFDDPFFMLQQNDFIITRQTAHKNFMDSYAQWTPVVSMFSTLFSIASFALLLTQYFK
jgi:polysaccharide export outer membrane protein